MPIALRRNTHGACSLVPSELLLREGFPASKPPISPKYVFPAGLPPSQTIRTKPTILCDSLPNCMSIILPLQNLDQQLNLTTFTLLADPASQTGQLRHAPSDAPQKWIPQPTKTTGTTRTTGPDSSSNPPRPPGSTGKSTRPTHGRRSSSTRQPPSKRSGMPWVKPPCFRVAVVRRPCQYR